MTARSLRWSVGALCLLFACVSTRVMDLGNGQYVAIVEQAGGYPSETGLLESARDAAAERCGSLDRVRFGGVSASTGMSYSGNHGSAGVCFACVPAAVAAPNYPIAATTAAPVAAIVTPVVATPMAPIVPNDGFARRRDHKLTMRASMRSALDEAERACVTHGSHSARIEQATERGNGTIYVRFGCR